MALTTGNALKALVEGLGLGITAYRGDPPQGTALPYVTVVEEIALVPDSLEDGTMTTARETAQVDLWQRWHDLTTGAVTENYTLAPALRHGLHGKRLISVGTKIVYMVLVRGSVRLEEVQEEIVHHAITVEVLREV